MFITGIHAGQDEKASQLRMPVEEILYFQESPLDVPEIDIPVTWLLFCHYTLLHKVYRISLLSLYEIEAISMVS
jgi:hypothetical protein